jgi:hypothetical protein
VAHLRLRPFRAFPEAILIPYSIHTISGFCKGQAKALESLVFEFGSDLQSITDSSFSRSPLRSLFFSSTVRFIHPAGTLAYGSRVGTIHFGDHSSLLRLTRCVFSDLNHICSITIPFRVKYLHNYAFTSCALLQHVEFELPSHSWLIYSDAFQWCPLLEPITPLRQSNSSTMWISMGAATHSLIFSIFPTF